MLEGRFLQVRYGRVCVLRGVSVAVKAGEVVAVLGPTGAGKTTLFGALVGDLPTYSGTVLVAGRDVTRLPMWQRARCGVGYIPQGPSVLPDLSVRHNLTTFESVVGRGKRGAQHWAELVGLSDRLAVCARELSGGERRRLELARALVGEPGVIVCDEPFSGMDPIAARKVAQLLRARAEHGLAVVLADHHASLALGICDRAALLLDGRVHMEGTADECRDHRVVREQYLGWD